MHESREDVHYTSHLGGVEFGSQVMYKIGY